MLDASRYVLLGSRGIIGSAFAIALSQKEVFTAGRAAQDSVCLDLDSVIAPSVFDGFDVVIHAAGIRDEDLSHDTTKLWRTGEGQHQLLTAIQSSSAQSIIYVSTAHVYGRLEGKIDEKTPPAPLSEYGSVHLEFEKQLSQVALEKQKRVIIVRPNAVYSSVMDYTQLQRPQLVPFLFPQLAVADGMINVRVPGVMRNFVDAQHIAHLALSALPSAPIGATTIINPVGSDIISMGTYAELVAAKTEEVTGRKVEVQKGASSSAPTYHYLSRVEQHQNKAALSTFLENYIRYLADCATISSDP